MRIFIGVDIGGCTTNGIGVVTDTGKLMFSTNFKFDKKRTKGYHRRHVVEEVVRLVEEYRPDAVVMETVKMFRGSNLSHMSSITSLTKMTGALIDALWDKTQVYEVPTVSWKASVLGKRDASKEDAVNYVKEQYKVDVVHDEADAICQAVYLSRFINKAINSDKTPLKNMTDK